jgi:hypothetical protein
MVVPGQPWQEAIEGALERWAAAVFIGPAGPMHHAPMLGDNHPASWSIARNSSGATTHIPQGSEHQDILIQSDDIARIPRQCI